MKYTYKITRKQEWSNFYPILIFLVLYSISIPLVLYLRNPNGDISQYFNVLIIGALMFFIIPYLIHIKYYSLNKDILLAYFDTEKKVEITNVKNKITKQFRLDEIKCVMHTMTAPKSEKRTFWFPWDNYNYLEIFLINGEKFIITSLMTERLDWGLGDKYQIATSFYPYPSGLDSIH